MPDQANLRVDWSNPLRCLLLGAAGSGMRTLGQILHDAGHIIHGADVVFEAETPLNPAVAAGFSVVEPFVRQLRWDDPAPAVEIDVCITSPAVPQSAPLYRWAEERSVPMRSLTAALGELFASRAQVCVAGTHGKSTTSALLAWMLNCNDQDAGVFVGAEMCAHLGSSPEWGIGIPGTTGMHGKGPLAVLEACEFGGSFLQLRPRHVLLNGIDGDHFDCFEDGAAEDAAYQRFLELVPADGGVFLNAACARSRRVATQAGVDVTTWSLDKGASANWCGRLVDERAGRMTLRVEHAERHFGDIEAPLSGRHNAENLLAAVAMASHLGLSAGECQASLSEFPGIRRRMEQRGIYRGMRMLDDYAHHPTAVTTTLQAVRTQFPGSRVRLLFEPHQVSRLKRCQDQFIQALSLADEVFVLPVFPAREQVSKATCHRISRQLAATISGQGTPAAFTDSVSAAASIVELTGRSEDIVLTMGAGTVHQIHDEVHRRFQRDPAA